MPTVLELIPLLQKDYPYISFTQGELFVWSPKKQSVTYSTTYTDENHAAWALLHEVAHATLDHEHYKNDIDLLRHEVAAWHAAKDIANNYDMTIDENHIEDCLDTYRDWLHKRATCPNCTVVTIQQANGNYKCFNCQTSWRVPDSPLCRITRRIVQ